ncbi:MAG TPA: transglycosylase domain-containing protein [Actinomycetota bacterium]|nr:transglycosylase domain-containing protein [Actinomycetota bacterium]
MRLKSALVFRIGRKWPWMAVGAFMAIGGLYGVHQLVNVPLPEMTRPAQSSKMLAHDGQVIATLHGEENRTIVPIGQISPHLRVATVAVEDREFYEHNGMSLKGVIRAARANFEGGQIKQGGSTITQQLARNTIPSIGRDRTYSRKVKEIYWAMQLERHMPKEEILERYLNTVYFGRGAYGAEAAARTYFKISAAELTPGQAAFLAGTIRSPERYQIDRNPEAAVQLRNRVLDAMVAGGYLGRAEADAAKGEDLVAQFKPGMSIEIDSPRAGYFVEYVRRILKRDFALTDEQILAGGLQIHTTLDLKAQDAAEAAVRSTLDRPDDPETALVAMDGQGRVRAMVGGRVVDSIDRNRGFNFAVDVNGTGGGRQAGSAFKPFALAAFLDMGKSLASTFSGASPIQLDSPTCKNADGKPWEVSNYGNSSYGAMDVTQATLASVNTVYAQLMDDVVSPTKFMEVAERTGIKIPAYDAGCALALGTTDVTPLEMARAYTTFAQRGNRPETLVVTKITHPDGEVIVEKQPAVERALDPNVADSVNYVLERNILSGTGTKARLKGRPAAGKTGTTQNFANAWFAGYTPELTAIVWMGYAPLPDGTIPEMQRVRGIQVTGGSFPAQIWKKFMDGALQGVPASGFHRPKLGGQIVIPKLGTPHATLASSGRPVPVDERSVSRSGSEGVSGGGNRNFAPAPPRDDDDGGSRASRPDPPPPKRSVQDAVDPSKRNKQVFQDCFPFC